MAQHLACRLLELARWTGSSVPSLIQAGLATSASAVRKVIGFPPSVSGTGYCTLSVHVGAMRLPGDTVVGQKVGTFVGRGADPVTDGFTDAGYGLTSVGWGDRPAIVVVDFQQAFCNPVFATGRSAHVHRAVARAEALLAAGRKAGVFIVHTAAAWSHDDEFGLWKIPGLRAITPDSLAAQVVPQLRDDSDIRLMKHYPSAFFGTDLSSILRRRGIDTVLIAGATTSGCVRATIVDAFSHGFRTMVVADACGDQESGPHDDTLRDVSRRYADLTNVSEAVDRLEGRGEEG